MPRPPRAAAGGLVYHVFNRGVEQMQIFDEDEDYALFERVLAEALVRERGVRLLGYCLMPDHWHLVLWPRRDGQLSEFMRWLTVTHTQRWHAHFESAGTGPVYHGRFKSFPVQQDDHLLTMLRFVESNALRAGLTGSKQRSASGAERWRWGSLWRWENRRTSDGHDPELPAISDWPVDRPKRWKQLVNKALSDVEAEVLRTCIKRSAPYGEEKWTRRTANRLGLASSLKPIGRPRKQV